MLFIILTPLSLLQYNCYAVQEGSILDGKEEGGGVPTWKCSIYGRGGSLMYRSEQHPLIVLKWCLHVGAEVGTLLLVKGEGNFSWEVGGVY